MYKDHKSTRHLKKMISFFELLRYFHIKSLKAQNHDFHQSGGMYWLFDYFGYFWCTFHRWKLKILWSLYWHMYVCIHIPISEFVFENVCIGSYTFLKILLYKNIFVLGLLGYFVSWQFGSCYSWIARKGDITGLLAPLFLIGCGTGGSIFPPVTGAVFRYIHYFTISTYQISAV